MGPMAMDKVRGCRRRGGGRLEALLIVLAIGLLVFLALPVYNSLKVCGWLDDAPPSEGNATEESADANNTVEPEGGNESAPVDSPADGNGT